MMISVRIVLYCVTIWWTTGGGNAETDVTITSTTSNTSFQNYYMYSYSHIKNETQLNCTYSMAEYNCTWKNPNGISNDTNILNITDKMYEGLYTCACNGNNNTITAVLGIYNDSTYCSNTGPVASNISIQVSDDDQKSFNISFTVRNGPPTHIDCNGPKSFQTDSVERVVYDNGTSTLVTITVYDYNEGNYTCNISNNRVDDNFMFYNNTCENATSATINIETKVTDTPENLTSDRLNSGLAHIQLSWTGTSFKYLVEIRNINSEKSFNYTVSRNGTSVTTMLNITENLDINETYLVSVVAVGDSMKNELPSNETEDIMIFLDFPNITNVSREIYPSNLTIKWNETYPIIPNNGYTGRIICDDCGLLEYNETAAQSPLIITYEYLTDNCTLTLVGLYGNDTHTFSNTSLEDIPLPLLKIKATVIDSQSINVTWGINSCVPSFNGYVLSYKNKLDSTTNTINGTNEPNIIITGLTPYTNYCIEIRSVTDNRSSVPITIKTDQSIPGVVTDLMSIGTDVNEITVSWNEPDSPNGIIICYHIQYTDTIPYMETNTTAKTYTIERLPKHNTSYWIRVQAETSAGKGEWSNKTANTKDIETVVGFNVTQITCTEYEANWRHIGSNALANYIVSYTISSEENSEGSQTFNVTLTKNSTQLSSLKEGIEYDFSIRAVYKIGGETLDKGSTHVNVSPFPNCIINTTPLLLRVPYLSVISSSALVLLLLITIISTAIIICSKRKKHGQTRHIMQTAPLQGHAMVAKNKKDKTKNNNKGADNNGKTQAITVPIPMRVFCDHVANNHLNSNKGFKDQYELLIKGEDYHSSNISNTPDNAQLNRFVNITVYDDNRVILQPLEDQTDYQNDYINASYIKGYTSAYKYIATQGPTPRTLVDFWRLIWQEKSPAIVMVTNLKEDMKGKCTQYWPDTGYIDFGPFTITLINQTIYIDYTERKLEIQMKNYSLMCHQVTQYHFTSWPDHGVPQYSNSMMNFHKHIKKHYDPVLGPMVTHCSAGVGRTGTFITIDIALQQIEKENVVDIPGIINTLRHQRTKMVQTVDQFIFINDAVLEYVMFGETQINVADLRIRVHEMNQTDPVSGLNEFQKQFELIEKVTPKPDDVHRKAGQEHKDLNRSMKYLPPDRNRVCLKDESNNYIHASFITSYKKTMSFIVAENPMQNTGRKFWKMVINLKITVIVMLGNTNEDQNDVCYTYWPIGSENIIIGDYIVAIETTKENAKYNKRVFKIRNNEDNLERNVVQYQITGWRPNGEIDEIDAITDVIEEVCKIQRSEGSTPIAVHCSDTVTRSGIFCASATAIEKCKAEKVIDIFQVVKGQRMQKPGSVPSHVHFQFIFEIVQTYLDSFEEYSNFKLY